MKSWKVWPADKPLNGEVRIPGDKSISHRALIFSALSGEDVELRGLLRSEDVNSTRNVLNTIFSPGARDSLPECDCGNSGTTIRLMMGVLAGSSKGAVLFGDESLNRRPMERVAVPLREMGADIKTTDGRSPVTVRGKELTAREIKVPVASAQVKSALLLAGLSTPGRTVIRMPEASRDHTERMLEYCGVPVETADGGRTVSIVGPAKIRARPIDVPGDISSAAFFMAVAAMVPSSHVFMKNVGINPSRTGVLDVMKAGNAHVHLMDEFVNCGEPRAEIVVDYAPFRGMVIKGVDVPRLIDEIPVLCLLAAGAAVEKSLVSGAEELKVKESDRIVALSEEMTKIGIEIIPRPDGMVIPGRQKPAGGTMTSRGDHRLAMTGALAGLVAEAPVVVEDVDCVNTSFPEFASHLRALGARIEEMDSGSNE